MCGISVLIHYQKQANCRCLLDYEKGEQQRLELLRNRGPNSFESNLFQFTGVEVVFHASVLHLRGPNLVKQPLVGEESGNVLLWNGEIFGGIPVGDEKNDTSVLLSLLDRCNDEQEVLDVLCSIQGPWAAIFFYKPKMKLFFGRDIVGRRSLLCREAVTTDTGCKQMLISSVGDTKTDWNGIPATGIFCVSMYDKEYEILLHPWAQSISGKTAEEVQLPFGVIKCSDLTSPITKKLANFDPQNDSEFLEFESKIKEVPGNNFEALFEKMSELTVFQKHVDSFLDVLQKSVELRVKNQSLFCTACSDPSVCKHRTVAILFSGGLDCTVLAVLADKSLPPDVSIDLINVSFEHSVNVNIHKKSKKQQQRNTFDSPDRISAKNSYEDLEKLAPGRQWNFVEVNISKLELQRYRLERIRALILPQETVLDDSIGCALWFASRGYGKLSGDKEGNVNYTSAARIVLLGMGADEQLAGYCRHRNRFQKDDWNSLHNEIRVEIDRIWERNLGRDDRIISDSGREARFPYLDENVVSFLNEFPIWMKASLFLPRGVGEKLVLRAAAHRLGLKFATVLPKRAIQFGSRIAHLEKKEEKGSDVCRRLQTVHI